jgi:hypothetical protein
MGVRKVGRCSVVVRGREFVWWVQGDTELRIASADKKFAVA